MKTVRKMTLVTSLCMGLLFAFAPQRVFAEDVVEPAEVAPSEEEPVVEKILVPYDPPTSGFYFSLDGRFELPVSVGSIGAITGIGGAGAAEVGFHLGTGWRFGLRYVFAMNVPGSSANATDITMIHNMTTAQVTKEFDKNLITVFPSWLIISPSLGVGIDSITGTYVRRVDSQSYSYGGLAFVTNAGLSLEIDTKTIAVPFIGGTVDMYFDVAGFVPYVGVTAGVRFDLGRIRHGEQNETTKGANE